MTGYAYEAVQQDMDMPTFALTCARAMSFCGSMRDKPWATPLPERFEVDAYYTESLDKAKAHLAKWAAMNDAERVVWAEAEAARINASIDARHAEGMATIAKLTRLHEQTLAWDCPAELAAMKSFMLEQLTSSTAYLGGPGPHTTAADVLRKTGTELICEVEYCTEELAKAQRRADENSRLLALLRESLPKKESPNE